VDRNPGAIEVFHAGHKAIRLPDLAASGLYPAFWNCSSTRGRGSGIPAARNQRQESPSSYCFAAFRAGLARNTRVKPSCCASCRGRLFSRSRKETTMENPFTGDDGYPLERVIRQPYRLPALSIPIGNRIKPGWSALAHGVGMNAYQAACRVKPS